MFARANPAGWAQGDKLTPAQINLLDVNQSRAVDGIGGGTYTPVVPIAIQGAGLQVAHLSIPAGGLFVTDPAAVVKVAGAASFTGPVTLQGATTVPFGTRLDVGGQVLLENGSQFVVNAAAEMDVIGIAHVSGQLEVDAGGDLVILPKGSFDARAGSTMSVSGQAIFTSSVALGPSASLLINDGANVTYQQGAAVTLQQGATATFQQGASATFQQGATLTISTTSASIGAGGALTVAGDSTGIAEIEWGGSSRAQFDNGSTLVFLQGSVISGYATLQANSSFTLQSKAALIASSGAMFKNGATTTQTGPTTFSGADAYQMWREVILDGNADQVIEHPQAADFYLIQTGEMKAARTYTFQAPPGTPPVVFIRILRLPGPYRAVIKDAQGAVIVTFFEGSQRPLGITLVMLSSNWWLFSYSGIFRPLDTATNVLCSE